LNIVTYVLAIVLAYLLGSFPAGYLAGRMMGVNVLEKGSGRTGGSNVLRSVGAWPALVAGALDVVKGFVAVWLAGQISGEPLVEVLAGAAVILGHCYSIFIGFRGGGGVGTSLGALAAIHLPTAAGLLALLLVVIAVSRYSSLGSLIMATLMPLILLFLSLRGHLATTYVLFGILTWVIVVYNHRPNIERLLQGTERRWGENQG
jgi:glycerol-3-phosphate acyltransferase PlsY